MSHDVLCSSRNFDAPNVACMIMAKEYLEIDKLTKKQLRISGVLSNDKDTNASIGVYVSMEVGFHFFTFGASEDEPKGLLKDLCFLEVNAEEASDTIKSPLRNGESGKALEL